MGAELPLVVVGAMRALAKVGDEAVVEESEVLGQIRNLVLRAGVAV
jgi:hypothetical protein